MLKQSLPCKEVCAQCKVTHKQHITPLIKFLNEIFKFNGDHYTYVPS